MNRSKIEWCDHTWNPITGCRHNCPYCYARKMTARFSGDVRLNMMASQDYAMVPSADGGEGLYVLDSPMMNETGNPLAYPFGFSPTLYRYRMDYPGKLKMGNNIFVGAMADVFGDWVPDGWLDEVFSVCIRNPIHNYLFLTKNPERYDRYAVPAGGNMWYGTSITRETEMSRADRLPMGCKKFVSMEPILEDLNPEHYGRLFQNVDWIILGAETGRNKNKVAPDAEWINRIVLMADYESVPVFMKDSLIPIIGENGMRRDFPWELRQSEMSQKLKKKLYDTCGRCKAHMRKSSMVALLARGRRGAGDKTMGFLCWGCFRQLCRDLGFDASKLEDMAEDAAVGHGDADG